MWQLIPYIKIAAFASPLGETSPEALIWTKQKKLHRDDQSVKSEIRK